MPPMLSFVTAVAMICMYESVGEGLGWLLVLEAPYAQRLSDPIFMTILS